MPNANRPSGPGEPVNERHDAVTQAEEIDELQAPDEGPAAGGGGATPPADAAAASNARHADRAAHTRGDADRNRR